MITVDGVRVEVIRKRIKRIYIRVYPPDGRVRLSVPLRLSQKAVRQAVADRLDWIRATQSKILEQDWPTPPEFVTGEQHYLFGVAHRLKVIETTGRQFVEISRDGDLCLYVRPGQDRARRRAILHRFYREKLGQLIAELVTKWEPVVGVEVAEWRIKRMKTRWGSCNIQAGRIWLNLELAKRAVGCVEYVCVHEMVHLIERLHNRRFWGFMDQFLPDWRARQNELRAMRIQI